MKIATFNIDWARKSKILNHYKKIEAFLQGFTFDFLIITEGIDLELPNYPFKYFSEQIPENQVYEGLNYSKFLNNNRAFRTIIYSQIPVSKKYEVSDDKTSLALEFQTEFGQIVFYATIIGTWFKKQPYAKIELENCINDCEKLSQLNSNIFIIGDLNTSFQKSEKDFTINPETTNSLKSLFSKLNLVNATEQIHENIDHIVIPKSLKNYLTENDLFIEKNVLSDHKGICIELVKV